MPHVIESQGPENRLSLIKPERNANQTLTVHLIQDTLEIKSHTDNGIISKKETGCRQKGASSV